MIKPHARSHARARRVVYTAVAVFYVLLFAALMWPVYPIFATIEPRVLEMPFSLAYVVGALILSFAVLSGLYLWEGGAGSPGDADRIAGSGADPLGPDGTVETTGEPS